MKYRNLIQAKEKEPVFITKFLNEPLARQCSKIGLEEGSEIIKFEGPHTLQPAFIGGDWGVAFLSPEMAASTLITLKDGSITSLACVNPGGEGVYEGMMLKKEAEDMLGGLGLNSKSPVKYLKTPPSMVYKTRIWDLNRVELTCDMAMRVWGDMDGLQIQFAIALMNRPFRVRRILGDRDAVENLNVLGIFPGTEIILDHLAEEGTEKGGHQDYVTIGRADRLFIMIPSEWASLILVRSCGICWMCGECLEEI